MTFKEHHEVLNPDVDRQHNEGDEYVHNENSEIVDENGKVMGQYDAYLFLYFTFLLILFKIKRLFELVIILSIG